jgi:hypothetical protein
MKREYQSKADIGENSSFLISQRPELTLFSSEEFSMKILK